MDERTNWLSQLDLCHSTPTSKKTKQQQHTILLRDNSLLNM